MPPKPLLSQDKIDILAIQETHLTPNRIEYLHTQYPRIHILNSIDPNQVNAKGVAIVMNKHRTRWCETTSTELIPGRAIIAKIPWKNNDTLNILAIYAPNDTESQIQFWEKLFKIIEEENVGKPDLMLGDFNLVENKIDRDPPNQDPLAAIEELQCFRTEHDLQDVWRNENPGELSFTYMQFQNTTRKSQSRIDRIYLNGENAKMCYNWKCKHSGIPNDHKLIMVRLENPGMPHIGKGRWAMPHFVLQNKELLNEIKMIGENKLKELLKAQSEERLTEINPQQMHQEFKDVIQKKFRDYTTKANFSNYIYRNTKASETR
ncbi:Endonuclease/exonuclease/phosphatase [Panaeolus papilionaceus]|nr:Endonuclease/exonuclease/phosphatase [Panaeolus papilionaceus]